jgi:hypothetical protein
MPFMAVLVISGSDTDPWSPLRKRVPLLNPLTILDWSVNPPNPVALRVKS